MKDSVVFTFGRFNPPTIGHQKLVDKVKLEAGKRSAEPHIYLSHSQDRKKNPLDYKTKIRIAQSAFGPAIKKTGHKTVIDILKMLYNRGVKNVVMVVGSDRLKEFDRILTKYNGSKDFNFDSVRAISAGDRDPDDEGVSGMSASKLRAAAQSGDLSSFKDGMSTGLTSAEVKKVYNEIRKTMGVTEEINLENIEFLFNDDELEMFIEMHESEAFDNIELVEKPLTVQQRLKRARKMKRLAPKLKRRKKILSKRMADPERLRKRSRKAAISLLRKRFAGKLGQNYASLSPGQKVSVDKQVEKKLKQVDTLSKRLLPSVRKKELERVRKARGHKSEELDVRFKEFINENYVDIEEASVDKKIGRRVSGAYGRPGSRKQKRAASKAVRQMAKQAMRRSSGSSKKVDTSMGDAPYYVMWSGQSHEWYGDEGPETDKGRYKPKGDGGEIVAINIPTYTQAQKIANKLDADYKSGRFYDKNVYGKWGKDWYIVDYESSMIISMKDMSSYDKHMMKYHKPKDYGGVKESLDEKANVTRVSNAIEREKQSDKRKWDRMKDRARVLDTRSANRKSRFANEEHGAEEEVEHLDELDKATYRSYVGKRVSSLDQKWDKWSDKKKKNVEKGVERATKKMGEGYNAHEENLDEVSRKTLRSYIGRAEKDVQHNRDKATYAYKTNNIHNIVKHHNKAVRRQKQVDKAKEKFSDKDAFGEAVNIAHDRFIRSHGKKAKGTGQWMFTHKRFGAVDYKDETQVHHYNGSLGDASKSAKKWAKDHGHSTAYVMEETEIIESLDKHIADFAKGIKSSESKSSLNKNTGKPVANMKHVETDAKPDKVFGHLQKMGFKKRKGYDPNPNSFTTSHNADTMTTKSSSVHHPSGVSAHFEKEHGSKMKVHFYKEELGEEKDGLKDSCWKNYVAIGTKKKNGKTVPNCVPKESVDMGPEPTDAQNAFANRFKTAAAERRKHREEVLKKGRAAYFSSDKYKAQLAKRKVEEVEVDEGAAPTKSFKVKINHDYGDHHYNVTVPITKDERTGLRRARNAAKQEHLKKFPNHTIHSLSNIGEETIAELDTPTLQRYKTKSDKDIDRRFKKSVHDDSEENKRKIANRVRGYARASSRLTSRAGGSKPWHEEVEQVLQGNPVKKDDPKKWKSHLGKDWIIAVKGKSFDIHKNTVTGKQKIVRLSK